MSKKYKYNYKLYDFNDKIQCTVNTIELMLNRTQSMFVYDGLPDSIPQRELELMLQRNGSCIIAVGDDKGTLYALTGGYGGELDVYYRATKYIVANPWLKLNKEYEVFTDDADAILCRNDSLSNGLLPIFNKYATMLTENEISIRLSIINHRIISLMKAGDDQSKQSAEKYLCDIEQGKLGVIGDSSFFDEFTTLPYATSGYNGLSSLIEVEQYLKASLFNEIGLQSNYNMKRESINSVESQLDTDALLPLIDDMLKCRKEFCEEVNEMFGTNITVRLSSAWEDRQEMTEESIDNIDGEEDLPDDDREEETEGSNESD